MKATVSQAVIKDPKIKADEIQQEEEKRYLIEVEDQQKAQELASWKQLYLSKSIINFIKEQQNNVRESFAHTETQDNLRILQGSDKAYSKILEYLKEK